MNHHLYVYKAHFPYERNYFMDDHHRAATQDRRPGPKE
jgi:hypothetical protein